MQGISACRLRGSAGVYRFQIREGRAQRFQRPSGLDEPSARHVNIPLPSRRPVDRQRSRARFDDMHAGTARIVLDVGMEDQIRIRPHIQPVPHPRRAGQRSAGKNFQPRGSRGKLNRSHRKGLPVQLKLQHPVIHLAPQGLDARQGFRDRHRRGVARPLDNHHIRCGSVGDGLQPGIAMGRLHLAHLFVEDDL